MTATPSADRRPPTRPLAILVGIAALTTVAVVAIVGLSRGGGSDFGTGIGIGRPVPNIAGTTLDGQAFDLATLRGRPVIVNFWASWCVPCQQEMPLLARKAAVHADAGLAIVGVLSDDTVAEGLRFESTYGATWPSVFDESGAIKRAYNVVGRPQTYFVDRGGILRSIQVGELIEADFDRQYAAIAGTP